MRNEKPISMLTVATVSAGLYAGLAVLFVPVLSFLFLMTTSSFAALEGLPSERWVTLAVVSPVLCGVMGFVLGAFMACIFNLLVGRGHKTRVPQEARKAVRIASISDAA